MTEITNTFMFTNTQSETDNIIKEDPLELLTCQNKLTSKYLFLMNNKNDELYNIYIELLKQNMKYHALHHLGVSHKLQHVLTNSDISDDMEKVIGPGSFQVLPVINDYDLTELDYVVDNNYLLLTLAQKWNCSLSIDNEQFFEQVKIEHDKCPIYNVKKWGMLFLAAQQEIKSFLMPLFPEITEITKVRKCDKNFICIYSNKYHQNDATYLNTYDFVALWTNCVRLYSGYKLINFDYSDWEVNMYGRDLMEISNKIESFLKFQKIAFNRAISKFVPLLEETLKKTNAYTELKQKNRKNYINSCINKFHSKAKLYWNTYLPYRIIRLNKIRKMASRAIFINRKLIQKNIRIHREIKLEQVRQKKEKLEKDRLEKERLEKERLEKERLEKNKLDINKSHTQTGFIKDTSSEKNTWRRGASQFQSIQKNPVNPWNNKHHTIIPKTNPTQNTAYVPPNRR